MLRIIISHNSLQGSCNHTEEARHINNDDIKYFFLLKTVMKWSLSYNAGFGGQYQYLCVCLCYKAKISLYFNESYLYFTDYTKKKNQSHKLLII